MENKFKHTPGPWVPHAQGDANYWCLITDTGKWVIGFMQNGELMTEEQVANAKLIAAAPDMLAALLCIQAKQERSGIKYYSEGSIMDGVIKAINKATT